MKKYQKSPQWIIAKRTRKQAKRQGKKYCKAQASRKILHSV